MSASTITLNVQSLILAPVGKNGKVSTNNSKAAQLLNESSKSAIVSAALTSNGAVRAVARGALLSAVKTLDGMLSSTDLDGSDWGDLLTLLVGEFGVTCFSRATMKGKSGCTTFLESVILDANAKFARAETRKQQDAASKVITSAEQAAANVTRLIEQAEQARIIANQQAEQAAEQAA